MTLSTPTRATTTIVLWNWYAGGVGEEEVIALYIQAERAGAGVVAGGALMVYGF